MVEAGPHRLFCILRGADQRSDTRGARYNGAARRIARPGNGSRSWPTTFSPKSETSIRRLLIASSSTTRGGSRVPELGLLGSVRGALSNERPYRDLRCAERKFISLTRRAVSHSSASAETAAVPRENDLLC